MERAAGAEGIVPVPAVVGASGAVAALEDEAETAAEVDALPDDMVADLILSKTGS